MREMEKKNLGLALHPCLSAPPSLILFGLVSVPRCYYPSQTKKKEKVITEWERWEKNHGHPLPSSLRSLSSAWSWALALLSWSEKKWTWSTEWERWIEREDKTRDRMREMARRPHKWSRSQESRLMRGEKFFSTSANITPEPMEPHAHWLRVVSNFKWWFSWDAWWAGLVFMGNEMSRFGFHGVQDRWVLTFDWISNKNSA